MGSIISSVTDAIGLTNSDSGDTAAAAATSAANVSADYQQQALDYMKEQYALPTEVRDSALTTLNSVYGDTTSQNEYISSLQNSTLYNTLMSGADEASLRTSSATGGIRGGSAISDVSSVQNSALLNTLNTNLSGLQSLSGLDTGTTSIANAISGIGTTYASGITSAANAQASGDAAYSSDLTGLLGTGAAFFSDDRLKRDVVKVGEQNGYPTYRWVWNKIANRLGLYGESYGTLSSEVKKINPDAVTMAHGYEQVNYDMIGVTHG